MLSMNDILDDMPNLRDISVYGGYSVEEVDKKLVPGLNSIQYSCIVIGSKGDEYKNTIQVYDIDFEKNLKNIEDEKDNWLLGKTIEGKKIYHSIPSLENRVKLKCQCTDFRFKWEYPLALSKNGSLIGSYRKYKRKTPPPPVGYPYANPDNIVGVCKHLYNFLRHLQNHDEIR